MLYLASIYLIYDSVLLSDSMHLMMNALEIWSLTNIRHRMCSIIYMVADTLSR